MGNNEPTVDQSDMRIRGSYGLNIYIYIYRTSVVFGPALRANVSRLI